MGFLKLIGAVSAAEHEAVRNNAKIDVEAMRQACIELVRDQQQYEGSDYPVCNHIVHMIRQVSVADHGSTAIGDLPSRLMGWAGKARAQGRDVVELDVATVDRIVDALAGETDWEAKFKTAVIDLEARDRELDDADKRIEALLAEAAERAKWNKEITDRLGKAEANLRTCKAEEYDALAAEHTEMKAEIAALRPDAEKHRAKLDRDRNRVRPSRAKAPTKGAK